MAYQGARPKPLSVILVFLGFLFMSSAWAISMPVAAGPDEPAHVLKAASVVRGELVGPTSPEDPSATIVRVPASIGNAHAWTCFAHEPTKSGACQVITEATAEADGLVEAHTTAGLYNPLYYLVVGGPTLLGLGPVATVFAMRILTALVTSVLIAWMFQVMSRIMAPIWAISTIAVASTPMVLFLNSVVNPNSFEIVGGAAFLVGLLWFAVAPDPKRANLSPALLIVVGGLLGANARGVSPLWMFLAGVLFLFVVSKSRIRALFRMPRFLVALGAVVAGALFGVIWVLRTDTLNQMGHFPGQDRSPVAVFFRMLLNAPSDPGLIAFFGWLDTTAPGIVYAAYGFGILALIIAGLALAQGRWRLGIIVGVAIFFLVPATLQAASLKSSGFIWQGRYSLVGLVFLLIICGFAIAASTPVLRSPREGMPRPLLVAIGLSLFVLAVAQFWAFFSNLQRYVVAEGGTPIDVFTTPHWSPPVLGTIPLLIVFLIALGTIAIGVRSGTKSSRTELVADLVE